MKKFITIILFASLLPSIVTAAPKIFQGGDQLHFAMGEAQKSQVYEYQGPYAIRWTLRDVKPTKSVDPLADYWRPHTRENPPWVSIRVREVGTNQLVESDMQTGWDGVMQVPSGGRHYLEVTATRNVAWTIWGKLGILEDSDKGIRQMTAAEKGGGEPSEGAEAVIESLRLRYRGAILEERIAAVRLIESRSNSVEDFTNRWRDYTRMMGW